MNAAETPVMVIAPRLSGLGQGITVCPSCAYFADGQCEWCPGENDPEYPSPRPECQLCIGQQRFEQPWYKRPEIIVPVMTTVIVTTLATVASSFILKRAGFK